MGLYHLESKDAVALRESVTVPSRGEYSYVLLTEDNYYQDRYCFRPLPRYIGLYP